MRSTDVTGVSALALRRAIGLEASIIFLDIFVSCDRTLNVSIPTMMGEDSEASQRR